MNIWKQFVVLVVVCTAIAPAALAAELKGLGSEVVVRRDARSIPYIEAKDKESLFFAQGYETAKDRLWQMDVFRRVAAGRLAELFGKRVLEQDKRWRKFGFKKTAEDSLASMSPELRLALVNYAKGVNAYIDSLTDKTKPGEFQLLRYDPEPWKPTDTILVGKILADGLSTTWWQDVNRLQQMQLPEDKRCSITGVKTPDDVVLFEKDGKGEECAKKAVLSKEMRGSIDRLVEVADRMKLIREKSLKTTGIYADRLAASNNWVIAGSRTLDGKAILANDPHLQATAPGIWYLSHLSAPGFRAAGVTFPGVPGIVLGHNNDIAWGATNVGPDVQDLYIEEFNDRGEYKSPDGWKKAVVRKEVIKVRKNLLSPKTEPVELEVEETGNGVIFTSIGKKKVALRWTAMNPKNGEFEVFLRLNSVKNWKGFREALKTYGGATQNFVYADVKNNIGWQVAGKIPTRRTGFGELPYDGTTKDGDWTGYVPFDDLPRLYNPKSGFILTANQRIAGTKYKYKQVTRQIAGPWRALRIQQLLRANSKVTMNDVNDVQRDVFDIVNSRLAREIIKRNAAEQDILAILKGWDGRMDADSKGGVITELIGGCVSRMAAKGNPGVRSWQLRSHILPFDIASDTKTWLPKEHDSWGSVLKACSTEASSRLKKRLGNDMSKWRYGDYSKVNFMHPLSAAPFIGGRYKIEFNTVGGTGRTPNVGENVSMKLIAKPSNWDETMHVIPLGQSGNPASKHWKDQFTAWHSARPTRFPFSSKAVVAATVSKETHSPKAD